MILQNFLGLLLFSCYVCRSYDISIMLDSVTSAFGYEWL